MEGIGDTLAVGHVFYVGNIPLVPMDDSWIPSQKPVTRSIVLPIGEVGIFLVYTDPIPSTFMVKKEAEEKTGSILSANALEFRISKKPTQPAPEVMKKVEARCTNRSEKKHCFVGYVIFGSRSVEGGADNELVLQALELDADCASQGDSSTLAEIRAIIKQCEYEVDSRITQETTP